MLSIARRDDTLLSETCARCTTGGGGSFRVLKEIRNVGKGDARSKRGKIFKGTFGKRRPKKNKKAKAQETAAS